MVSASLRSRESVNCGSEMTYWWTLKPAMAVETQSTPRSVRPRTRLQLNRDVAFFESFAILDPGLRTKLGQQLLACLPYVTCAQRQHQVSIGHDLQQCFHAVIDRPH